MNHRTEPDRHGSNLLDDPIGGRRWRRRTARLVSTAVALAAVGAAVHAWPAGAADDRVETSFVPTAGCRVFDYRPAHQVGPRSTPLGPEETHVQQITGGVGECVGSLAIPDDAVAVTMNVTAVGPTAASHLRVFPADVVELPNVSSLNVVAGQPPTPNQIDVALSDDGAIKLFNRAGSMFVLADVVGYHVPNEVGDLDDRVTAIEARLRDLDLDVPSASSARGGFVEFGAGDVEVVSLQTVAPGDGDLTVIASATIVLEENTDVLCSITRIGDVEIDDTLAVRRGGGLDADRGQLAGVRVFPVSAGETVEVGLVCRSFERLSVSQRATLAAIYTPRP